MVLSDGNQFLNGLWYEEGSYRGLWFGERDKTADPRCTSSESDAVGRALRESGRAVLYGIQFDTDSAKIRSESEQTLRLVVDVLKKDPELKLAIEGHTDSSNTDAYNQQLSQKRAEAVVAWLVENGVAVSRLSAQGLGESRPASDNATPQGRALNRRVEIVRM
jgi:outer membrane protein OmpA-like peptidoglycan-associated protein